MEFVMSKTWDKTTDKRILTLQPIIREDVTNFINEVCEVTGIRLRVTRAFCSFEAQDILYNKIPKITNAKGGYSFHNYGLAFDVVEITRDGKVNWNTNWKVISEIAKKYGFEWGGDFKSFKDKPHFQKSFDYHVNDLLVRYSKGQIINGYVKL